MRHSVFALILLLFVGCTRTDPAPPPEPAPAPQLQPTAASETTPDSLGVDVDRLSFGSVVYDYSVRGRPGEMAIRLTRAGEEVRFEQVFENGGLGQVVAFASASDLATRRIHALRENAPAGIWIELKLGFDGDSVTGWSRSGRRDRASGTTEWVDSTEVQVEAPAGVRTYATLGAVVAALPLEPGRTWEIPVFNEMAERDAPVTVAVEGMDTVVIDGAEVPVYNVVWSARGERGTARIAARGPRWIVEWMTEGGVRITARRLPSDRCVERICGALMADMVIP